MFELKKEIWLIAILLISMLNACDYRKNTDKHTGLVKNPKDSVVKENYMITCESVGVINKKDKELQLSMKFGEIAVKRDSLFKEGMFEEMITVVNSGKDTELKVHWNKHGQIKMIVISNPNSPYQYVNGIKLGTSLNTLTALNKKAISFYGFGWDYGGTISDLNGGQIQKELPCFAGVFAVKKGQEISSSLLGDKILTSDFPKAQTANIYLKEIRVKLN